MRFVGQHALFGGTTAAPFLAAHFFCACLLGGSSVSLDRFDFVEEELACEGTILPLLSRGLAFHLDTGRAMKQLHARGSFVHVLPAMTAGPNECFIDILFPDAEERHAAGEWIFRI